MTYLTSLTFYILLLCSVTVKIHHVNYSVNKTNKILKKETIHKPFLFVVAMFNFIITYLTFYPKHIKQYHSHSYYKTQSFCFQKFLLPMLYQEKNCIHHNLSQVAIHKNDMPQDLMNLSLVRY